MQIRDATHGARIYAARIEKVAVVRNVLVCVAHDGTHALVAVAVEVLTGCTRPVEGAAQRGERRQGHVR
jgi:hypothetical protein